MAALRLHQRLVLTQLDNYVRLGVEPRKNKGGRAGTLLHLWDAYELAAKYGCLGEFGRLRLGTRRKKRR